VRSVLLSSYLYFVLFCFFNCVYICTYASVANESVYTSVTIVQSRQHTNLISTSLSIAQHFRQRWRRWQRWSCRCWRRSRSFSVCRRRWTLRALQCTVHGSLCDWSCIGYRGVVGRYVHLLWCCSGTVCAVGGSRESLVMYICVVQCIAQSVTQPR